jgi:membrane protease YdiL (CAAX protease family)
MYYWHGSGIALNQRLILLIPGVLEHGIYWGGKAMNLEGLRNMLYLLLAVLIFIVVLLTLLRYFFEKLISSMFKRISLKRTSLQLFVRAIILILFNLGLLAVFGMLDRELFILKEPHTGLVILSIGFVIAFLVSMLSFMAIKAGFGTGYDSLATGSALDLGLTLTTFTLLAGPSEDIFFVGFIQNFLTPTLEWGAIVVYLLLFVAYHYANVLSGVETKREFLGTLPVRLIVSCLLGVSFYLTETLLWGLLVHNLVDTVSYVVLLVLSGSKPSIEISKWRENWLILLFLLCSIIVILTVAVLVFFVSHNRQENHLIPLAGLALGFILAGILVGETRLLGYGLIGVGVTLAVIDIFRISVRR